MKRIIGISIGIIFVFGFFAAPILAKTATVNLSELQALIQQLQQQIQELKAKIEALLQSKSEIKEAEKEVKTTLRLIRQLRWGMSGEDVELLQEILATDPDIYPEGLVTGYFGPLTHNAVKRLQKVANFEQVGQVGPKTLRRLNEILAEGAGSSGKVPPGLLIAPGIRKKLAGTVPQPLPGQELPPGIAKKLESEPEIPDTTAPVAVTDLSALNATASSVDLSWTAPGDDGSTGTAASYDVRYSTSEITSENWSSATQATEEPTPSVAGTVESMTISGLSAETTYHFALKTSDEVPNESNLSNVPSLATSVLSDDTTAPVISELSANDITSSSTTIIWVTDEEADSKLWHSTSTPVDTEGSTPTASDSGLTLNHSLEISDLVPDTTYYYVVSSADAVDNATTSSEDSFETSAE